MTAYADWETYNNIYLVGREPSIPETDFPYWERRARTRLDSLTFNRLHDPGTLEQHSEDVVLCVCELAEHYASDVIQESKGLSSMSVTGHSMTFDKNAAVKAESEITVRYLGNTGLLYRGL